MKKIILSMLMFVISIFAEQKNPEIIATLPVIKFIVDKITGNEKLTMAISKEDADPHFYDAKLSYIVMLKNAKLLILMRSDFEVYVEALLSSANNPDISKGSKGYLELSTADIDILDVPQSIEKTQGDLHAQGNPHFYLSPINFKKMSSKIFEKLKELYPKEEDSYRKNLEDLHKSVDTILFGEKLVKEIKVDLLYKRWNLDKIEDFLKEKKLIDSWEGLTKKFNDVKNEKILSYHKSFTYFLQFFKLNEFDVLEAKPGIPPSTARLLNLIQTVNKEKIKVILIEPFYPIKTANFIKEKVENTVCVITVSTNFYNYLEWLKTSSEKVYKVIKDSKCD